MLANYILGLSLPFNYSSSWYIVNNNNRAEGDICYLNNFNLLWHQARPCDPCNMAMPVVEFQVQGIQKNIVDICLKMKCFKCIAIWVKKFPNRMLNSKLTKVLLFFVGFWELSHFKRDLSRAEKKITVVTSWATDKMTTMFSQNDNFHHFEWNRRYFVHLLSL